MRRGVRWFLAAGAILAGVLVLSPPAAEARGSHGHGDFDDHGGFHEHGGFHGGFAVHGWFGGPFYGPFFGSYWYPYCGFSPYWGACYGPYGPYDSNSYQLSLAGANGIGAVDLNVKPGNAEVWVDGNYVAEARDLDGSPGLLWLKDGAHHIVIYKGGYSSFDESISVHAGRMQDLKVRLEKGESQPPGVEPGAKAKDVR
jgi:hypothetical protein